MINIIHILVSTALYTLSFPKFNLWWLSFFALVPLFCVLDNSDSLSRQLGYGILWGILLSVSMGYWVFLTLLNHYGVSFPKAILFFCLCVSIPVTLMYLGFVLAYRFMHKDHLFFYALVVPSLWVLIEYVKEVIPVMVPWGGIGYPMVSFYLFIQAADVAGIHGITFLVVMVNSLLGYMLRQFRMSRNDRPDVEADNWIAGVRRPGRVLFPIFLVILVVTLPVVYGKLKSGSLLREMDRRYANNEQLPAVLIQGSFSAEDRWSGMGFYSRLRRYLEMTGTGVGAGRRLIVWPETVLNSPTGLDDHLFLEIISFIGKDTLLISGGLYKDIRSDKVFNCSYFISGMGRLTRYDKHILLPYAETSPAIDLLDRYYNAPSEFSAGQTPVCIQTPLGRAGASICFELLYPDFVKRSVKEGAAFLVNISNDAWFDRSPMPYFHLNAARVRAIENRRFLLRASNSGISAIISPDGRIITQSRLFTRERITGQFLKLDRMTLFSRYGNLILYFTVIVLLAVFVQAFFKKE